METEFSESVPNTIASSERGHNGGLPVGNLTLGRYVVCRGCCLSERLG